MTSRELYEAFNEVEDRYLNFADAPEKEKTEMKHHYTRKAVTFLIAAAICVSILAVTALAAGWVPGIFRALAEKESTDQSLFEAAAQANTEAQPEMKDISHLDLSKFTLFERYYDGETILLGYDMSLILPEPSVGYVPSDEEMEFIKQQTAFPVPEANPDADIDAFKRYLHDILSEEDYKQALESLDANGYICLMTHNVFIGDHIYVNGADIGEVLSEDVGNMRYDYETAEGSCIRMNPLPEAGKNQDQVTVTLKVKSHESYEYFDLQGHSLVFKSDNHQEELMDFTLDNVNKQ